LRSCAIVFAELGNTQRAVQFLSLDAGSDWANNLFPSILLREGDIAQARVAADKMSNDHTWFGGLLQTCLAPGAAADMDKLDSAVRSSEKALLEQRDPEFHYLQGSLLAFCGERQIAVRLLQMAISQNYCSTEALANDPLLEKLRPYPEFNQLRSASQGCLDKFLAGRK